MFFIFDILSITLLIVFQLIKATWWIVLPVVLFVKIKPHWLNWRRSLYGRKLHWLVLEISLPPDVLKTPKAMENVLMGFHGAWSESNFRDKWIKGESSDQFSLELVGSGGEMHFYIRCQSKQRNFVESKIYAQYPDAQIQEVPDYMDELPPDIPSRDHDLWGADFILVKKNWAYPILTYLDFEDIEEERRIDSLSQLGEMIAKMQEGEYIFIQIIIMPLLSELGKKSQDERDKLMGREVRKKLSMVGEVVEFIHNVVVRISGGVHQPGEQGQKEVVDIQRLTPGERSLIEDIERKASKLHFGVNIRAMYLARKDVMHREHIAGLHGFFRQFAHQTSNGFKPGIGTFPSGSIIFFKKTRNYIRKKRLFIAYKGRMYGFLSEPYALNTEELASIFHFPGIIVKSPLMPRVPSRTGEPPSGLPR